MTRSDKPALAVTRRFSAAVEARIRRDYRPLLNEDDRPLDADGIIRLCEGAEGLLTTASQPINAKVLSAIAPHVKVVATYSVGYEHIDLDAARRHGIAVTITSNEPAEATADIAMLLILAAVRRAREWQLVLERGQWARWNPTERLGIDMRGARLGFVGMGRIGQHTLRRARPFGCKLQYWSRRQIDPRLIGDDVTFLPNLEALFEQSDIVSVHVPGGADTAKLVNRERLALMPKGGFLINTARGTIVDDDALIEALQSGHLGGAGLDVFANEPNFDPRYKDLENAFLLPHIGSATRQTRDAMGFRALDNLDAFFAGQIPPDQIA